ncbi:MAG: BMP family ABC transporter substrate-binding protein [Ruminococcus sp.]|nr:BMP family ABC transporter substrate-binding protein [Ruminococcus sp.]
MEMYYKDALKLAQKEYRACTQNDKDPYLPVLDDIVSTKSIAAGIDLGLVSIPADQIVGTKSKSRVNAFAPNFMPILDEDTEFAKKWNNLCQAHLTEGIREPIKAYEYMNRFYVEEGNKRVSVLKFFDAVSIMGHVIRVMPEENEDEEAVEIYLEFVEFYKYSKINFLEFSKKGGYSELLKLLDKSPTEEWTDDERNEFSGVYHYFKKAYLSSGGVKLQSTVGDALLSYIKVYGYDDLKNTDSDTIKKNLDRMWEEVTLQDEEAPIELKLDPAEEKKPGVLSRILPVAKPSVLKVAFLYDGTSERSGWVHGHELGRRHVQRIFDDKIETKAFPNAMADNDPLSVIEQAIEEGYTMIFTTSPRFTQASLRAAVEHPDIVIMNCSLNKSHRYIRTYYTRMYEAKFILGAIAGSLTESDKIGYVCDYPIYGQIAGINAFALGAQMINPRAKVYLEWSATKGAKEAAKALVEQDIHLISSQDTARFQEDTRESFGLSYINGDDRRLIANPVWKWDVYYEEILRSVFNKTMQAEYDRSNKALNYYWGMSAGVVDVEYTEYLERPSLRLANFLKESIIKDICIPFLSPVITQKGDEVRSEDKSLSPEQIINMDYLVENVIGTIPKYEELSPMGKATVDTAGVEIAQSPGLDTDEAEDEATQDDNTEATGEQS